MYKILSSYYDAFMSNVDYDKWTDYVCSFIKDRRCGADAGCGTGRFTVNLFKRGYDVYGFDISPQMLNVAHKYAKRSGVSIKLLQGDLTRFEFLKPLDFVTAMCDTVNYIKDPLGAFTNVYNNLNENGVFVFDISTEYKLTHILGFNTYSDACGDITYIWNNYLDAQNKKLDIELTFFEKSGELYKKRTETQIQYLHSVKALTEKLITAGFSEIKVYSETTLNKIKKDDERVHFVALKK